MSTFRPDDMRFNATLFMISAKVNGETPITDLLAEFGKLVQAETIKLTLEAQCDDGREEWE